MNTIPEIRVTYSACRPKGKAWCASSEGKTTYAGTKEEAYEQHQSLLELYRKIDVSLRACAANT